MSPTMSPPVAGRGELLGGTLASYMGMNPLFGDAAPARSLHEDDIDESARLS